MVAILRTTNGKTIAVRPDSLTEQEKADIRSGINFFYQTDHHICHWLTCSKFKDKQKKSFNVEIDNRYEKDND